MDTIDLTHRTETPGGGFTIEVKTGREPTTGYVVGTAKKAEMKIDWYRFTPRMIDRYVRCYTSELAAPGTMLGGWHNPADGLVYVDIVTVVDTRCEAEKLAAANGQQAYYDIAAGESIYVDQLARI
jgi:hypothetical protein